MSRYVRSGRDATDWFLWQDAGSMKGVRRDAKHIHGSGQTPRTVDSTVDSRRKIKRTGRRRLWVGVVLEA